MLIIQSVHRNKNKTNSIMNHSILSLYDSLNVFPWNFKKKKFSDNMQSLTFHIDNLSLVDLLEIYGRGRYGFSNDVSEWLFNQSFAKEKPPQGPGKYKFVFDEELLINCIFEEQKISIPNDWHISHISVLVQSLLFELNQKGKHLMPLCISRTSNLYLSSSDYHVTVGNSYKKNGIWIGYCSDKNISHKLPLVPVKKIS